MPHPRQVIREAVRAALLNATAAGATVYETRVVPHRVSEVPALAVYTLEESVSSDSVSVSPRELRRELSLVIEGWVAAGGATNVDDDMDELALEVETAMYADPFFGGVASESLLDTTSLEVIEEGDRLMGWIVMTYAFTYFTDDPPAPADLDDFETGGATHNLGGAVHEDDQAEDVFTVQESP
jgi:hypothetical protein